MLPRNQFLQVFACAMVAVCLLLGVACSGRRKGNITREKVAAVLDEIEEAAKSKDVDAIVKHFSDDARIKVIIKGPDAIHMELSLTPDEYRDHFKQSYNMVDSYSYERKDTVINVNPDGQSAVAADEVVETMIARGKTVRSVTRETATFKIEGGRVVITSFEGTCYWN